MPFKSFRDPDAGGKVPLFTHAGPVYRCTGCGGEIKDGMYVFARVRDGKVMGIAARRGPDGPVEHECGNPPTLE